MLSQELNDLITRTGPGTGLGDLMRRYWLPALLTEELPHPDCPPVQVRLLGDELVAFRDTQERIGLLAEHCSHRGTSLFYGRNENCGLRCIYHGWQYDVDGNVLDTPAEPGDSDFKRKIHHPAYPTREVAGIIFTYLGPPQKVPEFPCYEWATLPTEQTYVAKSLLECNYLQGVEGECDSSHLSFLHRDLTPDGVRAFYAQDSAPVYETEKTDFGMRLIATRKTESGDNYVRVSSFVMPTYCWVPALNQEVHTYVPIDDTHTWRYDLGFLRDRRATPADNPRLKQIGPGYRRLRTAGNHYLQDREAQRTSDFTGIEDFLNEDACATESMGSRYDRSQEKLALSDKAVIAMRHYLIEAVQAFQAGAEPPHLVTRFGERNAFPHIDTLAQVIPGSEDWRTHFPHLTLSAESARGTQRPLARVVQ